MAFATKSIEELRRESDDLWRRRASHFSLWCMSNTKWRKVFAAIEDSQIKIDRCAYKCIDEDHIAELCGPPPRRSELLDCCLEDARFCFVEYRMIEWFRFPRSYKPMHGSDFELHQDLDRLHDVIASAAHAYMQLDRDYLYLFGYLGGPEAKPA